MPPRPAPGRGSRAQTTREIERRRRQKVFIQWGLVIGFAVVALAVAASPPGKRTYELPLLHGVLTVVLAGFAINGAWGTWLRFRMDGTGRAWLISAAWAGLGLFYLPFALTHSGNDPVGHLYGALAVFAYGALLVLAFTPLQVPQVLRQPRVTGALLFVIFQVLFAAVLRPEVVEERLGSDPSTVISNIQLAGLVAIAVAVIQLWFKFEQTRRPVVLSMVAQATAIGIEAAVLLGEREWSLTWWVGHLGIGVSGVIFILATERQLGRSMQLSELRLFYQPKIDLHTNELKSVEALLRWNHPDFGIVSPVDFLTPADETDLLSPMTHWAIREAVGQHKRWLESDLKIPIAVNITARMLRDRTLVDLLHAELDYRGVGPDAISLELTESQALDGSPEAIALLEELRAEGVGLSVDDYGTGYSSLSYVRTLPVTEIKLDRSFVMNVGVNEGDTVIVRSTIEMARQLDRKVVAEGIEDEVIRTLLQDMGCDLGQGYLWSKPLPPDQLAVWAREHAAKVGATERRTRARRAADAQPRAGAAAKGNAAKAVSAKGAAKKAR